MDPTEWLQSLGLERYAAAFRENEIDETVLLRLTAEDLKDIGVGAIGHRRKLLDAIAALRTDAKGEMPAEVASTPSGERRQVTVMFSDLVGSTALSTRMDPEDLREVISAYQKCVADTVQHFGGFVAKYMGDGVLVYFGYPQAHEDDAERAVRAGLELVAAVGGLKTHAPLLALSDASGQYPTHAVLKRSRKTARSIRSRALLSVAQSFFVAQSNLSAPKFRQILKNAFDFRKENFSALIASL